MIAKAKAYPYPYLSAYSNDYLKVVEFELEIDSGAVRVDEANEICIPYQVVLKSPFLSEGLVDQAFALVFDIRSPSTFYSEQRQVTELIGELLLDGSCLDGSVTIVSRLIATGAVGYFRPEQLNPEFDGAPEFEIEAGDLLGETATHRIPVRLGGSPREFTPKLVLNTGFESFQYQVVTDKPRLELHVGLEAKRVVEWMEADNNLRPYLWMGIYKDVLLEALKELRENSPDLNWAVALEYALAEEGIVEIGKYASSQLDFLAQKLIADLGVLEVANGIK